jgi:hypothetical protein
MASIIVLTRRDADGNTEDTEDAGRASLRPVLNVGIGFCKLSGFFSGRGSVEYSAVSGGYQCPTSDKPSRASLGCNSSAAG